jgi:hypothetical protein
VVFYGREAFGNYRLVHLSKHLAVAAVTSMQPSTGLGPLPKIGTNGRPLVPEDHMVGRVLRKVVVAKGSYRWVLELVYQK